MEKKIEDNKIKKFLCSIFGHKYLDYFYIGSGLVVITDPPPFDTVCKRCKEPYYKKKEGITKQGITKQGIK